MKKMSSKNSRVVLLLNLAGICFSVHLKTSRDVALAVVNIQYLFK